jgi:hypothetical protein
MKQLRDTLVEELLGLLYLNTPDSLNRIGKGMYELLMQTKNEGFKDSN